MSANVARAESKRPEHTAESNHTRKRSQIILSNLWCMEPQRTALGELYQRLRSWSSDAPAACKDQCYFATNAHVLTRRSVALCRARFSWWSLLRSFSTYCLVRYMCFTMPIYNESGTTLHACLPEREHCADAFLHTVGLAPSSARASCSFWLATCASGYVHDPPSSICQSQKFMVGFRTRLTERWWCQLG